MSAPTAADRESILSRLGAEQNGSGWKALCPAHNDHKPSLSIDEGTDGRLLYVCRAGCEPPAVAAALRAMGISLGANGTHNRPQAVSGDRLYTTDEILSWPSTRAFYVYQDAEARASFAVRRTVDKQFPQYRAVGPNQWVKGRGKTPDIPFRFPELLRAARAGERVFAVEGERDVLSLVKLGMVATCNPGGAEKWRASFVTHLVGADVVILPDNDPPGEKHALQVARSLRGAATIKIVRLPGLPPKGDVSDWLEAGGTREELEHLVAAAPAWEATAGKPVCDEQPDEAAEHALAAGRERLADLPERVKENHGAAFEPDILEALATVRTADPSTWAKLRQDLKTAKFSGFRDLDREIGKVEARAVAEDRGGAPQASSYAVENGSIVRVGYDRDGAPSSHLLCNFSARIVAEEERDDGAEVRRHYVVTGRLQDGTALPEAAVPADRFPAMNWTSSAWGPARSSTPGRGPRITCAAPSKC